MSGSWGAVMGFFVHRLALFPPASGAHLRSGHGIGPAIPMTVKSRMRNRGSQLGLAGGGSVSPGPKQSPPSHRDPRHRPVGVLRAMARQRDDPDRLSAVQRQFHGNGIPGCRYHLPRDRPARLSRLLPVCARAASLRSEIGLTLSADNCGILVDKRPRVRLFPTNNLISFR